MSNVSSALAILQAGYDAQAQAKKSASKSRGWVACKVEGIDFDCIRDAIRGFSEELIAGSNISVFTSEEFAAREYLATRCLFTQDKYLFVDYSFDKASALFEQAGLSFERL
jgi:hypothetical protein